ncbi:MAG: hypothetical protein ABI277_01905, partial [Burkholderiaceae bacterium]
MIQRSPAHRSDVYCATSRTSNSYDDAGNAKARRRDHCASGRVTQLLDVGLRAGVFQLLLRGFCIGLG